MENDITLLAREVLTTLRQFLLSTNKRIYTIMASQAELAADMAAQTAVLVKIAQESAATLDRAAELQAALDAAAAAGGTITPELQSAWDALKAQIGVVDALVPDVPPAGG